LINKIIIQNVNGEKGQSSSLLLNIALLELLNSSSCLYRNKLEKNREIELS